MKLKICLVLNLFLSIGFVSSTPFPSIQGKNLLGKRISVPGDLQSKVSIYLVAFKRHQQENVDTWFPVLNQLSSEFPELSYYEFPVMPRMSSWRRWFVHNGMKMGIRDHSQRERTISFHINKEPFKEALGIESEDVIQTYLVDHQGEILSQWSGDFDSTKESELRKAIQSAISKEK